MSRVRDETSAIGRPRPSLDEGAFRLLVDGVRDYAIVMLDPDGIVIMANAGVQALEGYAPDEVVGRHFSIFYPPEDVRAGKCDHELRVAAATGRFEDHGLRVRKDGSRFFANVVITALRGAGGELRGFGKIARDITESRAAEEALRRSEEQFRLLVTGTTDYAIFMLDPRGRILSWNPGAERIKGYTADEAIGQHFSIFYTPEDLAAGKSELELTRAVADGRFEEEGWRVRKDGTRFWASVVLSRLLGSSGELLGFVKVTRDLTERRRAEETRLELAKTQAAREEAEARSRERAELVAKLETANAELAAAVRAREDFLAIASHELKTPLYTLTLQLTSTLWLTKGEELSERVRARLDGAQREVQRMTKLVTNLLDVSKITARRLDLEPTPFDLVALTREILAREHEDIARSGSTVTLDAPESLVGRWDRLRLDQVIANLLANALKYGERKPVTVRLARRGDRAHVAVIDTGLGIDPADHDRIFRRFERAVSPRSYSGFGLGLWIVQQIVDAMGGTIAVESARGKGSAFTVDLPIGTAGAPS